MIIIFNPSAIGLVIKFVIRSISELLVLSSKNDEIWVSEIEFPYEIIACSNIFSASLKLPEAFLEISWRASFDTVTFSDAHSWFSLVIMISIEILLKSNLWHLEIIVRGNL